MRQFLVVLAASALLMVGMLDMAAARDKSFGAAAEVTERDRERRFLRDRLVEHDLVDASDQLRPQRLRESFAQLLVGSVAAGAAESIPLKDNSCGLAWLSHVWHHVRDRHACARELRRVLGHGSTVLVRGTFGDKLDGFPTLFRYDRTPAS